MSGEEHEVVSQDPELALPFAGGVRTTSERTPQPTLVPGESGLGLPPLAVHPPVPAPPGLLAEPLHHLASIPGLRPLAALPAAVERDDRGPDAEVLPGVPVVLLGVERRV